MEQLYELLKSQPKGIILCLIYKLMMNDKFSFAELAELHVNHLEELKKCETEKLIQLRGKVITLWCDYKKNIGQNLIKLMQEAKDNGWANLTQEQIDNSKWNKNYENKSF